MPDISKVILNGATQMDVTQDTVAPGNLLLNETATMNNGTRTVGTLDLSDYALKAMFARVEATTTSTDNYFLGDYLICQNNLRVATEPIGVNQTIDNSNSQVVLMADELRNAFGALQWSIGADAYEPTGYASTDYADGMVVLCGGQHSGLYQVYDISTGDDIPNGPDVVSIDIRNMIDLKANESSPIFTGTPKAPTAAAGTNTTQIATTAFVQGELSAHGLDANGVQLSSANDLDNIVTTGWYYWTTTVPSNSPTIYGYGSMYVDHAGSNIKQTVFRDNKEYTRNKYGSNAWPAWHEVDMTSLAADLTLHVDAVNGNDSNDGLSAATALKTINAACTKIPYDTAGRDVTILLAEGTYSAGTIQYFNNSVIKITKESSASASNVQVSGFTFDHSGSSSLIIDSITFTGAVTSYAQDKNSLVTISSCVFDGGRLTLWGPYHRVIACTFRNISSNTAINIGYGYCMVSNCTFENTVRDGIWAIYAGTCSVYSVTNNATNPYKTSYSGRIFVGGRTYKETTGVENIYYTSTPFSVTGDKSITLTGDMQNYSTIILYLTTSSTNTSGNRCMVRFTPWELGAAPEYVLSTNGTNFYGVRLGLVTNNVYTQLRFISTTAPNLYIVQAVGVIQ